MKKWSDRLFLLVIAAVLFAVPVASAALFLTRGDGISYYENRTLTARPAYTEESFWDGSYFSGWEDWYSGAGDECAPPPGGQRHHRGGRGAAAVLRL